MGDEEADCLLATIMVGVDGGRAEIEALHRQPSRVLQNASHAADPMAIADVPERIDFEDHPRQHGFGLSHLDWTRRCVMRGPPPGRGGTSVR